MNAAMLARSLAAVALTLAASPVASAQDVPSGTVKICRQAGVVDIHAGLPIGIPRGATFIDNGILTKRPIGGSADPISIATIEAAQIAAGASCTTARARISQSSAAAVGVRAADGRRLSPSRGVGTDLAPWPGNLYLFATIESDFR